MSLSPEDRRLELLINIAEDACKSAAAQYEDYYKSFSGLDGKAQAAATVAGVVMGAVFAFFNSARLQILLSAADSSWTRALAVAPAAVALVTVILAVIASFVRSSPIPFAPERQMEELSALAGLPADRISNERVLRYYQERLAHMKRALEEIGQHVTCKGRIVTAAQGALLITLSLLLLVFIKIAYSTAPSS